jgi:hypothetical protein
LNLRVQVRAYYIYWKPIIATFIGLRYNLVAK